jgi:ornithine cyclodeaminase/alanine dehydrogenase
MVLLIGSEDVKSVLTMADATSAVEEGFKQYSSGRVQMPVRITLHIHEKKGWVGVMSAYMPVMGALATKVVTSFPENIRHGHPTITAIIVYNDPETGIPLAIMEAEYITSMRTGAAGAVAVKHLAIKDARTLGIIGTGAQAKAQVEAACRVRDIREVKAYDLIPNRTRNFAMEMSKKLGIDVIPVENAKAAVTDADIVVTATSSKTPVFRGEWVKEGVHINGIGSHAPEARELDDETVRKAKIVVDSKEAALREAGDLMLPLAQGIISESSIYAELGEIILGVKKGRESEDEVTLFKSVGLAVQDVSIAKLVFDKAKEKRLGKEVSLL